MGGLQKSGRLPLPRYLRTFFGARFPAETFLGTQSKKTAARALSDQPAVLTQTCASRPLQPERSTLIFESDPALV